MRAVITRENGTVLMNLVVEGNSITKLVLRNEDVMYQGNRVRFESLDEAIVLIASLRKKGLDIELVNKLDSMSSSNNFVTRTCSLIIF